MSASLIITTITSAAFGLTALYVAIARRQRPTWKAGVVELLACCILTLAHVLKVTSPDSASKIFWYKITYFTFTIIPTAFLWLALIYRGYRHMLTPRVKFALILVPIIYTGLIFTNEYHGLMWDPNRAAPIVYADRYLSSTDAGIGYWIFVAYSFLVMGVGVFFLTHMLIHSRRIYGRQVSAIIFAGFLATLGCALDVFGVSPLPSSSMTALGLAIGSITVAYVLAPFRRQDITSVTRAAIFKSISDCIIVIDEDNQIVDINPSAEKLFGKPASQLTEKSIDKSFPELRLIWDSMVNKNSEVTLVHGNIPRTFDLGVSVIQDWRGRIASQVIVLRDITERKEAEKKIHEWNIELERRVVERTEELAKVNKDLEAFAYSISHDLRAPLRVINGYTSILYEDYGTFLDAEGKRLCTVIHKKTRFMQQLIDDILSLSRSGRVEMRITRINMEKLANSVFQELTSPEDRERIDFHVIGLPQAFGDPALIHQVWMNILSNAIKYTTIREQAIIQVTGAETGKEIIYTVKDNGTGFDMNYVDKIFSAFQRLHDEKDFPGTGVGLAIVQRIIQRHEGRVWAEGKDDQGATFYFSLPKKI
jgi:PAS domain S-box-containing protein